MRCICTLWYDYTSPLPTLHCTYISEIGWLLWLAATLHIIVWAGTSTSHLDRFMLFFQDLKVPVCILIMRKICLEIDGILKDKSESVISPSHVFAMCARSLWKSLNLKAQCRRTGWFLKWMRREHTWFSTIWLLYETLAFFATFWRWDAHWPSSHTALTFVDSHTLLSSSFFLSFKILVHENIFHLTGTRGRFNPWPAIWVPGFCQN